MILTKWEKYNTKRVKKKRAIASREAFLSFITAINNLICRISRLATLRSRKITLGALQRLARCVSGSDNSLQDEMCASRQRDERHIPGRSKFQTITRFKGSCLNWLPWTLSNLCVENCATTLDIRRRGCGRVFKICAFADVQSARSRECVSQCHPHSHPKKNIPILLLPLAQHTRHF